MDEEWISFTIDGQNVRVPKGTTVYSVIKKLGINVPIFCYQDRMPPFGACRVCLVEVEKMTKPQASCTLVATEGMRVNTQSALAVKGREDILEFLLLNHPLDCPVCDRGGECPLQDQVLEHGPGLSRFYEDKRRFAKPLSLGPVLTLDRERCIVCARCTRFCDIISGDHALELHDRGFRTEVSTPGKGPVVSKFIGNTIMICPVGALTSSVYRFEARPWDNLPAKSTCTLCPVGCSMVVDSRDGEIMRIRSLENKQVNDIWLCDKGWFGYEFASHANRLQTPFIRKNGALVPASWEEALSLIAEKIQQAKQTKKIAGIGGNPLTLEENIIFQKFMRDVCETNNIDHRTSAPQLSLQEEGMGPGMEISLGECEDLSLAVLFGVDLTEEFPLVWLRLKQAINKGATVLFFGNYAPEIAPHLHGVFLHPPGSEIATIEKYSSGLSQKGKAAFFVGRQYLQSLKRLSLLAKIKSLQSSNISINILEGKSNALGARFAGVRPDLKPYGEKIENPGLTTSQILETASQEGWDLLYVVGANIKAKTPSHIWDEVRKKLNFLIVQDIFLTETAKEADVLLPTLCYLEKDGHFMNIEGRLCPISAGKNIPNDLLSDGAIFGKLAKKLGKHIHHHDILNVTYKRHEQNIPFQENSIENSDFYAVFAPYLFDQGIRMQHNTHLNQLAKEPRIRINSKEANKLDIKDEDFIRISAKGYSLVGKVHIDKGIADKTIVLPLGFPKIPVQEFGNLTNGLAVQVKKEYQHKFNHVF